MDKMVIFEFDKLEKDKMRIVLIFFKCQKEKNWQNSRGLESGYGFLSSSKRKSSFSLEIRVIQPSAVFGIRRKVALHGAGYAWTLDLRSFDKLREVGVSPYLGFTLYLCVFQCFGLFEAMRGHLIGPKTWDRIMEIFLDILGQSMAVGD